MSNNDLKVLGLEGTEQLVEEIKSLVAAPVGNASIIGISVTEAPDGTVTMVHTLDNGETETLVISPDANGNPNKLTHNDTEIPITWTDNGYSGGSGYITVSGVDELPEDADDGTLAVVEG